MAVIFNTLKDKAKENKYPETKDAVYQFFVQTVRDSLHIVLSFSPVGSTFRNRCIQFPSIINCCTIDWFNVWPDDALNSVAERVRLNGVCLTRYSNYTQHRLLQE